MAMMMVATMQSKRHLDGQSPLGTITGEVTNNQYACVNSAIIFLGNIIALKVVVWHCITFMKQLVSLILCGLIN